MAIKPISMRNMLSFSQENNRDVVVVVVVVEENYRNVVVAVVEEENYRILWPLNLYQCVTCYHFLSLHSAPEGLT